MNYLYAQRNNVITVVASGMVILAVTLAATSQLGRKSGPTGVAVGSTGPTITEITSLGELVVLRSSVADILEGDGEGYRGCWLIKGDALMSVDLRSAKMISRNVEEKLFVLQLPQPRIIQPRVDHRKTKTWSVVRTTWIPWGGDPDKLRDGVMQQAQELVECVCRNEEMMEQARTNTTLVLEMMFKFIGWTVEIEWEGGTESS